MGESIPSWCRRRRLVKNEKLPPMDLMGRVAGTSGAGAGVRPVSNWGRLPRRGQGGGKYTSNPLLPVIPT